MVLNQYFVENFVLFLTFLTVTLAVTWIAHIKHYFSLPFRKILGPRITLKDVLVSFLLFLGVYAFLGPKIMHILYTFPFFNKKPDVLISVMHFIAFILTVTCLFIYNLFQDFPNILRIFKDPKFPGNQPVVRDIALGIFTWLIAIPTVIALSQLAEMFTSMFFGKPETDQIAVDALKQSISSPIALITILISILLFAPFLEEYLFRGLLLSWLRNKLGSISAIFISALAFALLHFSPKQDWTNIPLIISLFTFGCYLGFVYEKSRSLFSSIVLHVTFNLISVMRIILTEAK